jgi:hypothetical protein
MSTWRKKAIECAPELKKDFEDPGFEIYSVFSELLSLLIDAHRLNDTNRLQKIYSFAEWCFRQKDRKIWNAAGVGFYEHLGDTIETFSNFTIWIKKDIYFDIRGLLQLRLEKDRLNILDNYYKWEG